MDKAPEYKSIAPVFLVGDVGATLEWYQTKLGFWSDPFPSTEPYVVAILFRDHIEIMLQRLESIKSRMTTLAEVAEYGTPISGRQG